MKRLILGGIAALTLLGAVACGDSSGSTPRKYDAGATALALAATDSGTKDEAGSPALSASCKDSNVDSDGVGLYKCDIRYEDGTLNSGQLIRVDSAGRISAG